MDDTPLDDLLADLESADPADAPEVAHVVAARLSDLLDETGEDEPAPEA